MNHAVVVLHFMALAVLGTALYQRSEGPGFRTLTGPEPAKTVMTIVPLRVAFQETAPEREIRELLKAVEGRIVDGPSAAEAFIS